MPNTENNPFGSGAVPDCADDALDTLVRPDVLSIGNVARMFGLSQLTLRYYEMRGLIGRRDHHGRLRVYSWADCDRLAFIIKCRKVGIPLSEIRTIIWSTDDEVSSWVFQSGLEKCVARINWLEHHRKVLDEALAELQHVHSMLKFKLYGRDEPLRRDGA